MTEDGGNPTYTSQPAEQQPDTPDEADQLTAVDDPIGERREQAEEREETQAEEVPDEHQAEETREETNEGIPTPTMAEETIERNPGDRPQRNRQAQQCFTYYAPGHPTCYYCGATITHFKQQTPQFFYHQPDLQRYPIPILTQHPWKYNYPTFPMQW